MCQIWIYLDMNTVQFDIFNTCWNACPSRFLQHPSAHSYGEWLRHFLSDITNNMHIVMNMQQHLNEPVFAQHWSVHGVLFYALSFHSPTHTITDTSTVHSTHENAIGQPSKWPPQLQCRQHVQLSSGTEWWEFTVSTYHRQNTTWMNGYLHVKPKFNQVGRFLSIGVVDEVVSFLHAVGHQCWHWVAITQRPFM